MPDNFIDSVRREIDDIHAFFENWFGGRVPQDERQFERFRRALAPSFSQVNPEGRLRDAGTILRDVWNNWHWFPGDPQFRIWIANTSIRHVLPGDHVVAVYEEWHHYKDKDIGRACTAVLRPDASAPNGVLWLQMHESMMG
jgi:hypothetical protein